MVKTHIKSKSATTQLPLLWESGFFQEWRSASNVTAEFAKVGCHFTASAVSKALARAKFITRKGSGSALRYIQTYPYEQ